MSSTGTPPAAWYADPSGRYELRYYDGTQWTEHVSSAGRQGVDPLAAAGPGAPGGAGAGGSVQGGTVFTEPVLVIKQKFKATDVDNEYAITDQHGRQIAAVRESGRSKMKQAVRFLSKVDKYLTYKLAVVDMGGNVLLELTRPPNVLGFHMTVSDGRGYEIGTIAQDRFGGLKIKFNLQAAGGVVGTIDADSLLVREFIVTDHIGTEVARVAKTENSIVSTTGDTWVVRIHRPLDDPLRSLVVASALTIDTAIDQDADNDDDKFK